MGIFTAIKRLRLFEIIALPICLVSFLYSPFFNPSFGGGPDGEYHVARAQDLIEQFDQGRIFPGVAETEIAFNGQSHYHDPLRVWIYSGIYHLWPFDFFHKLNGVSLSYWATILIAFLSFFLCRHFFLQLSGSRYWSFLGALTFATCPGLLSLLYIESHFPTQIAWLWAPGFFYYLVLICQGQATKSDLLNFALFAASLMFSHPASFLWTLMPASIFAAVYLFSSRGGGPIFSLLLSASLGLLFSLHHMIFITTTKGSATNSKVGNLCTWNSIRPAVDKITGQVGEALEGVFLPISAKTHWLHLFQPGYLVLTLVVLSGYLLLSRSLKPALRNAGLATLFFLGVACFGLGLEKILWRALPCSVIQITEVHFLRTYLPLVSFTLIVFFSLLRQAPSWISSRGLRLAFFFLIGWSLYQAHLLKPNIEGAQKKNQNFASQYLDPATVRHFNWANSGESVFNIPLDGALRNRFLDSNFKPISGNSDHLQRQCSNPTNRAKFQACSSESCLGTLDFQHLEILSKDRLQVLFLTFSQLSCHHIRLRGPTTDIQFASTADRNPVNVRIDGTRVRSVEIWKRQALECVSAALQDSCLISYSREDLPIAISSFSPYRARISRPPESARYLETHRMHLDFYRSEQGTVLKAPGGQLAVALGPETWEITLETPFPWWYWAGWAVYFLGWALALLLYLRSKWQSCGLSPRLTSLRTRSRGPTPNH